MQTVIVGCGAISAKHIAGLKQNRDSFTTVGVFDPDIARAQAAAATVGPACHAFSSMEEMAAACPAEVAVIASPSSFHAPQAVFWLERGAHLVLEKPVALSTADIERIAAAQKATGRLITVGYVTRYAPHLRLLARAVQAGRFGRIFHVGLAIHWNRGDQYYTSAPWRGTWQHDGGTLMNQATHGLDLLQWLLGGRPTQVSGTLARFLRPIEADDFAAATITFADGGIGTVQVTADTYPSNLGTRLTILGDTGTVELSGNGPDAITAWRFPPHPTDRRWDEIDAAVAAGGLPWPEPLADGAPPLDGHAGVYQDLALAIAGGGTPIADFAGARVSAEIVLGILQSHQRGERVGFPIDFATHQMRGTALYPEKPCNS